MPKMFRARPAISTSTRAESSPDDVLHCKSVLKLLRLCPRRPIYLRTATRRLDDLIIHRTHYLGVVFGYWALLPDLARSSRRIVPVREVPISEQKQDLLKSVHTIPTGSSP